MSPESQGAGPQDAESEGTRPQDAQFQDAEPHRAGPHRAEGVRRAAPRAIELATSEDTEELGRRLGGALAAGDVVVLTGPLGAGKTTLTRGIGEGLGVRGPVASPTFVVARTHPPLGEGPALVHVDAYRLRDALELDDLDLDLNRAVTIIEWGAPYIGAIAASWLELVLDRPRALASGAGLAASNGSDGDGAESTAAEAADLDEAPRRLEVRAVGDAWPDTRVERLLARLAG